MLTREAVEEFLLANGVKPSDPEDKIKSVLLSANWDNDEVDAAVFVLRESDQAVNKSRQLNTLFNSDEKLDPSSVGKLLGISMEITPGQRGVTVVNPRRRLTLKGLLTIILISLGLSAAVMYGGMYYLELGPFHVTKTSNSFNVSK